MNRTDWLNTMRAAGDIRRYHTTRTLRPQSVAAHTWGMLLALMTVNEGDDAVLMQAVMLHDAAELATGDVPAPAKWKSPPLAAALHEMEREFDELHGLTGLYEELTERQRWLLKWSDIYELTCWCLEEVNMGNTYALELLQNGWHCLVRMEYDEHGTVHIQELTDALTEEARKHGCR